MTEDRVERAMEHFGDVVEKTAEGAAAVLDKSMNFAWGFRPVRFVSRSLTFLTGAGLMVGSIPLEERGYHKTAKACLIGGGIVVAAQIAEMLFLSKD